MTKLICFICKKEKERKTKNDIECIFYCNRYENEMTVTCEKLICCCCDKFFDECIYQIDNLNNFILLHRFSLNLCNYDENS